MNFISSIQAHMPANTESILTIELAHIWRSKIADKCAEAERYVLRLLTAGGGACASKAPLSQKIENLGRLIMEEGCLLRAEKIRLLLARLAPLSDLRSELVHSTMSMAEIDGETVAVLHNAAAADFARTIFSAALFKACHKELSQVANSLRQEAGRGKLDSRFRGNDGQD